MNDDFEHETAMPELNAGDTLDNVAYEAALNGEFDLMDCALDAMRPLKDMKAGILRRKFSEMLRPQKDTILRAASELLYCADQEKTPKQEARRKLSVYFSLMDHVGRDGNDPATLEDLAFEPERLDTLVARLAP